MTPERWARTKGVFGEAFAREGDARAAFLEEACGGDASLRAEVESLLASHDSAAGFLDVPAIPAEVLAAEAPPDAVLPGERIGPYQLVRELGHGGMGTVYLAERVDDAFRKQVAIKVIRSGFDSAGVVARFRNERQILAGLAHPNVATLLDGGTTGGGLPYLVMEHVDGEPIDRYCDAHRLAVTARLELFLAVCSAVEHAHRRLVVHRDLKPGNILITKDGEPKLLDFGVAKLLDPTGADDQTSDTSRFVTPAFASPEQILGEAITTATDVYSLGALLYVLLTGQRAHGVSSGGLDELMRIVRTEEPERPSAVVMRALPGEGESPVARAAARCATPARLRRQLAGDLDTIVLAAMRREPTRRYASVERLAEDVRRHLAGRTVSARTASVWYRTRKFAARNRAAVVAVALVVFSIVAGLAESSRQRARAETRFQDVRALAGSFLFEFHDAIRDLPGATPARVLVVKRAQQYLASLARDAGGDIGLQRELAASYQKLGEIQYGVGVNLGDYDGARNSFERALAIRRTLATSPAAREDIDELVHLEWTMGVFFTYVGDLTLSEGHFRAAAEKLEELMSDPSGQDRRSRLGAALQHMAFALELRGELRAAIESLLRAVAAFEGFVASHPENAGARGNLAYSYKELADCLLKGGNVSAAQALVKKARGLLDVLLQAEPNNTIYRWYLVTTRECEAECLGALGKWREAVAVHVEGLAQAEALEAADPVNRWYQTTLVTVSHSLGMAENRAGDARGGVERLRGAASRAVRLVEGDVHDAFVRNELASIEGDLGQALAERGAEGEACEALLRAARGWEALVAAGSFFCANAGERDAVAAALRRCPER
jgi:serine/threonine protein kinase/tetratricopeptide (TPR) repeat protein